MGPIGFPETLVMNYLHTLRNTIEERRSLLLRGGSLKSRTVRACCNFNWKKNLQMSYPSTYILLYILGTLVNHDFTVYVRCELETF
jgi:hypothetical protein